jgi:ABC-type polysaccharide/polyol phosphate transport system ATPase subunit
MSSDARITFDGVWKKFHRGAQHDSLRDLIPALTRRMLGRAPRQDELEQGDFWAVRDLSFEVLPGQTLGIIGPNGSGKSTTLRMLTKILAPTRGRAEVVGRVGALIEVSAGFHGDLTGRENVFLQGAIMGMRGKQIERKFDEIVEFSGIPEFIDTPVKRYSSGMNARLGFSIAAHLEPDVLIIDEVLAVGDMSFQSRAFGRIKDLANSGIPVVIVSHQLDRVAELCSDAILMRRGELAFRGTANEVISSYVQNFGAPQLSGTGPVPVEYTSVRLIDDRPVRSGTMFGLQIEGRVLDTLPESVDPVHVRVRSLFSGQPLFWTWSRRLGADLGAEGPFAAQLDLQANLAPGTYIIEVSTYDSIRQKDVALAPTVVVQVIDDGRVRGSVQLNPQLSVFAAR